MANSCAAGERERQPRSLTKPTKARESYSCVRNIIGPAQGLDVGFEIGHASLAVLLSGR